MTQLLHRERQYWSGMGGLSTAEEIAQQPAVWRALAGSLPTEGPRVAAFLGRCLDNPAQRVILTGAGSSAYAGEIIADTLDAAWPARVRAVPTTSLLTHPELYLDSAAPTLLVSFARSGDSPESVAAVELLRTEVPGARFLHVTCNPDGALARQADGNPDVCTLLMPAASCDRGFAMTSSFTAMVLAALSVLSPQAAEAPQRIEGLAGLAERALAAWAVPVAELAAQPFERVVYLGAGPLEALAKEAALKILELTAGRVQAMANTPLGFRHGPKAAVNGSTLVVLFHSAKALARRYDADLLAELRRDGVAAQCVTVGGAGDGAPPDFCAPASGGYGDAWLAPLWLLMAQQFALHQSARLALRPDNPFAGGTVNRVVQGVTIYTESPSP